MKKTLLSFAGLLALTACPALEPVLDAQPHSSFELAPLQRTYPAILPGGVAVLFEPPACDFEILGEIKVTNYQIAITPSRIDEMKEEAAMVGADAILVHPNLPSCPEGGHPPICPGRGEYAIASAIKYIDEPENKIKPMLEYDYQRGYDHIEYYNHP